MKITAVICTRNRGEGAAEAARSVLANSLREFELIVIDQSTDDRTAEAIARLPQDPRLVYRRVTTAGLSRARNEGLRLAQTELVAFTDDDCEVAPNWLETVVEIFSEFEKVAVCFCSVLAGPHDRSLGFIPAYECPGTTIIRDFRGKRRARGMGAGLAVRKSIVWDQLGGFDEMLGAGAPFSSCEDGDCTVRALLAGYEICETNRTSVLHHGFRTWEEGRELGRRDFFGIGAAYVKPIRRGHWEFAQVPIYEFVHHAVLPPILDAMHFRKPKGVTRTYHFLSGVLRGWFAPMEPDKILFQPRS